MTVREIQGHLAELYDTEVSPDLTLISCASSTTAKSKTTFLFFKIAMASELNRNYRPVGRRKGNISLSDPLAAGVSLTFINPASSVVLGYDFPGCKPGET